MDKKYGSRKFIIATLMLVGANIQCAYGNIDAGAYGVICGIAGGLYQWANVTSGKKND